MSTTIISVDNNSMVLFLSITVITVFFCAQEKMKKTVIFLPGRITVSVRRGPSGHLRQDPSDETMKIKKKKNPSLQDKSP